MMAAVKQQASIRLSVLLDGLPVVSSYRDCEISAVQTDSRQLEKNDLFIALPGVGRHGLDFVSAAVKAGAACVLFDQKDGEQFKDQLEPLSHDIELIAVESVLDTAGCVFDRYFSSPSKNMSVVAVTGTDGKTSVSRFLAQVMSATKKAAVIGTTGNGVWGDVEPATHTTPDMLSLHQLFAEFNRQSVGFVAMEVSSHGIDQKRIAGIDIDTAVLTNVSRDHLDYHGSVENYREVKKQLFSMLSVKNVVANIDDSVGKELADELGDIKNTWVYGFSADATRYRNYVHVREIKAARFGFNVQLQTSKGDFALMIPLLGRFNVSNILSVVSVLLLNNIDVDEIVERISSVKTAPGRMEVYSAAEKAVAVVDYAHTPKALELSLKSLKEHFSGKVWCVFGCGGDRDQGKRSLMGAEAEALADYVIVTDDNPRFESSNAIIEEILSGFKDKSKARVIADRKLAIEYACEHAAKEDVILVAGKGHETVQIVGDQKIPFSDSDVVRASLGVLS